MPKRKRGTEKTGAHLAQEPSTRPPLRKSTRLLERESHPSPSTTRSTYCPTQLSKNNTEKSTNDTSFESHLKKTPHGPNELGAGHKRKQEKEPGPADTESRKRPRKSERAAVSLNLNPKKRLKFFGDDSLSKKQRVQSEETVSKTNVSVIKSPEKPVKELGVREIEQEERHDLINY